MQQEEFLQLKAYARNFGGIMGLWWILSFACFVGVLYEPALSFAFDLSIIAIPFIAVYMVSYYRDRILKGVISLRRGFAYAAFILFYATLILAIAQWVSREDSFFKKFVSNLFYQISDKITNIHIQPKLGCFRAMRREVVDELKNFPEKTATTLSLLYFIGSNYVCVPLKRDARFAGTSGYNINKMLSLTFARIFSFSLFCLYHYRNFVFSTWA